MHLLDGETVLDQLTQREADMIVLKSVVCQNLDKDCLLIHVCVKFCPAACKLKTDQLTEQVPESFGSF